MKDSLISVIVPVYNVEAYLKKCVDSILSQTYPNLEIILVDDGSPDNCGEICDNYAELHSNIKVIHQKNGGLSAARNAGLKIAEGEYIGFVDSDDFIDSNMYQTLYEKAKETDSDIVECNLHHTFDDYEDTETVEKYDDKNLLLSMGRCIVWNKIYRRSLIEKAEALFPEKYIYEDVEFYLRLIPHIERYGYVDIAPYHYVQRSDSLNNFSSEKTMQIFQILKNILDYYTQNGFFTEYKDALEFFYARIILCSSFSRMCRIPEKNLRKTALTMNWEFLQNTFPEWRKNLILKKQRSYKIMFMLTVNSATYKLYTALFPTIYLFRCRMRNFKCISVL